MKRWFRMMLMMVCVAPALAQAPGIVAPAPMPGVLATIEVQRLMPTSVFFEGQTATVQIRNSFGVRFRDHGLLLAGLVDTGGYSSAIRDRYQFYLLADTTFEIGGKRLGPGAYGCGFLSDGLLVMDLGGHDVVKTATTKDAGMARPRPLQITGTADEARLYLGREYVTIRQVK
ncbi:hypothetical protein SAMN05421771_3686 [Granulicella pectinivorans]|jgi:hypothetical protein|uniref:Uncharacterized protein n=1 Tax=Granulicella pectinivorans TaxID=474950 RepID=A0A1I6MXW1_9BACT|nr:hypothetical protein [Granulicella pectinivorans]SFS20545.1 hypothetical protein SAMN05421771_3686 [Granulicella pectinivorans]